MQNENGQQADAPSAQQSEIADTASGPDMEILSDEALEDVAGGSIYIEVGCCFNGTTIDNSTKPF